MPNFVRLFMLLSLIGHQALAVATPADVVRMANEFNLSMNVCPAKVWEKYDWSNTFVVLVYTSKREAYLWDGKSNSVSTYNFSALPPSAVESSYEFFEISGRPAMSLRMDEPDEEYPFELGIHEFFHHLAQKNWVSTNPGVRGTSYPLKWEARYYRRMLFDSLKRALTTDSVQYFQEANFWYQKWKNQFPREVATSADGYEGSAQYAGVLAKEIAKLGCNASNESLRAAVIRAVEKEFGSSLKGDQFALDFEGYDIGGIAILLLKFKSKSNGWQRQIAEGISPLEILLSAYTPKETRDAEDIKAKFRDSAANKNSEIGWFLDESLSRFGNPDYIRISVPFEWNQTNLFPVFFAVPDALGGATTIFPLALDHRFISPDQQSSLKLKQNTVVFMDFNDNPCSQPFILMKSELIQRAGEKYVLNSEKVQATVVGSLKSDSQGRRFICL